MCVCVGGDLGTRLGLSLIGQRSTICIKTEIQHFVFEIDHPGVLLHSKSALLTFDLLRLLKPFSPLSHRNLLTVT